jgi:hypothetical protein
MLLSLLSSGFKIGHIDSKYYANRDVSGSAASRSVSTYEQHGKEFYPSHCGVTVCGGILHSCLDLAVRRLCQGIICLDDVVSDRSFIAAYFACLDQANYERLRVTIIAVSLPAVCLYLSGCLVIRAAGNAACSHRDKP